MIWLAPAVTAMRPKEERNRGSGRGCCHGPRQGPPAEEPIAAARAPASMAPSVPRLITPASLGQRLPQRGQQGGGDPDRAGREGDEEVVIHLSKPSVGAPPCEGVGQQHDDDDDCFDQVHQDRRHAGLALQTAGARLGEAKSKPLAMMPSGFSRASKATAMPVKP